MTVSSSLFTPYYYRWKGGLKKILNKGKVNIVDLFPASISMRNGNGHKSASLAKEEALRMKVVSYDRVHIQVRERGGGS